MTILVVRPWICLYCKQTNLQHGYLNYFSELAFEGQVSADLPFGSLRRTSFTILHQLHPPTHINNLYENQNNIKVFFIKYETDEWLHELWAGKPSFEVNLKNLVK